jgi:ferredoxin
VVTAVPGRSHVSARSVPASVGGRAAYIYEHSPGKDDRKDSVMHVSVDQDKCVGSGRCSFELPDVFDQNAQGMVDVVDADPPQEAFERLHVAAQLCPAEAIRLEEPARP